MSKIINILKKTYIYFIILLFYIPLMVGAIYSFSQGSKRGDMSRKFTYSGEGWHNLVNDESILRASISSVIIGVFVSLAVISISLLTVFGLWKQKNKTVKAFVSGTSNIPLINPDIITGVMLTLTFSVMFGMLEIGNEGVERAIIAQTVMIVPFGISLMLPRSNKFSKSLFEASKDLGYGPIRTWFKTYFRYMLPMIAVVFLVSMTLSFDDFIIVRTTSTSNTWGTEMYQSSLKPWILSLGTIFLVITLSSAMFLGAFVHIKQRRRKNEK